MATPSKRNGPKPGPLTWIVMVAAIGLTVGLWYLGQPFEGWLRTPPTALTLVPWLVYGTLLHGNPAHLVFNLFWIWNWGPHFEGRLLGPWRTAALMVVLATTSGAAQLWLSGMGIGLSGVIYGMGGLLWQLERGLPDRKRLMKQRDLQLFGGWFLLCVILTATGTWNIGNVAHGSGWLVGAAAGYLLRQQQTRSQGTESPQ